MDNRNGNKESAGFAMNSLRIRVGAACSQNDSILLVEHEKEGKRYWLLPGGGAQVGETMKDALVREVLEETSMTVKPEHPVCICESISPDKKRHIVHAIYKATRIRGEPGTSRDPRVRSSAFIPANKLDGIVLYPPIQDWLRRQLLNGFSGPVEYLGSMWI